MSELSIVIPPPRTMCEPRTAIALVLALAVHALPLVAAGPEESALEALEVASGELDDGPDDASTTSMRIDLNAPRSPFWREHAIEAALESSWRFRPPDDLMESPFDSTICVGALGHDTPHELTAPRQLPYRSFDDGEFYLVDDDCPTCWYWYRPTWKVKPFPQLARSMRPVTNPSPVVSFVSQGDIPRDHLIPVIKRNQQALAACDDTRPNLGEWREREVELAANFVIDPGGHATSLQILGSDDPIGACVKRVVSAIRFPRVRGWTRVNLPLRYGTTVASADVLVR